MSKIITIHDYPPIPIRDFDWSAIREDYDKGDLIGTGKTEQDAINNLKEQEAEQDEYTCRTCDGAGWIMCEDGKNLCPDCGCYLG